MKTDITGTKKRIEKVDTRISELSVSIENQQAIFKTAKEDGDISSIASQNQKLNVLLSEKSALQESIDLLNSQLANLELEAKKLEDQKQILKEEKEALIHLNAINKKVLNCFVLLNEIIEAGMNPPEYFNLRIGNITRTARLRNRLSAAGQITALLNSIIVVEPLQGQSRFEIVKFKTIEKDQIQNILDQFEGVE